MKGNLPLVIWDFGKEIAINMEDALFSPKSMSIMWSNGRLRKKDKITRTLSWLGPNAPTSWKLPDGRERKITKAKNPHYYNADLNPDDAGYEITGVPEDLATADKNSETYPFKEGGSYLVTWDEEIEGNTIEITPDSFPGTLTNRASLWGSKTLTKQFGELLETAA